MTAVVAWIAGSGVVQGVIIGAALAFGTAILVLGVVARRITTTDNGWSSIRACGRPENGVLVRGACAKALPAVNVWEEAAYWTATRDEAGRRFTGSRAYVLHFPAGGLPPAAAFWSLTMTDVVGYMMRSPTGRHSVGDRTGLERNEDGSVDIYLQHEAPRGHEQNWLPAPRGRFALMLRAYLPGPSVLDGSYRVPQVRHGGVT